VVNYVLITFYLAVSLTCR